VEQLFGQAYLTIDIDRGKIARHGINVAHIREIITTAIGRPAATAWPTPPAEHPYVCLHQHALNKHRRTHRVEPVPHGTAGGHPLDEAVDVATVGANGGNRVSLCRGAEAAALAAETARKTFEEGASDANLPTASLGAEGLNVVQGTTALGFAASNKEVRRKLAEGAIRVNGDVVSDPTLTLKAGDKLSFGTKKHGLITA
jgi:hypothetical protein